jgi:hypothetical protein
MDKYTWRHRLGTTLSAGIGLGDAGNGAGKRGADDDVGHTEAPAKRIPLLKLMQLHGDWLGEQAMLSEVVQFGQGYARAGAEMPAAVYSYLACNYLLYARSRADAAIAYDALLQLRDVYPRPNIIPVEARGAAAADEAPSDEDDHDAEVMAAGYDHEMALDRAGLGLPGMWPATLHAMSWLQLTRAIDGKLRAVPCSWARSWSDGWWLLAYMAGLVGRSVETTARTRLHNVGADLFLKYMVDTLEADAARTDDPTLSLCRALATHGRSAPPPAQTVAGIAQRLGDACAWAGNLATGGRAGHEVVGLIHRLLLVAARTLLPPGADTHRAVAAEICGAYRIAGPAWHVLLDTRPPFNADDTFARSIWLMVRSLPQRVDDSALRGTLIIALLPSRRRCVTLCGCGAAANTRPLRPSSWYADWLS